MSTDTTVDLDDLKLSRETLIRKDGGRQNIVRTGQSGPTIVLLHGYADSWRSFEGMLAPLAPHFRLVLPDQRGHGHSDPAASYTVGDFVADAIAVIEATSEGPVALLGHSLGGIVAQRIAAARPDLVDRLILIGTAPTAAGHADIQAFAEQLDGYVAEVPAEVIAEFQTGTAFTPLPAPRLATILEESAKLSLGAWQGTAHALADDPGPVPERIEQRSLVFWGERDNIFDAASQGALADLLARATYVHFRDVGHAPNWEVPGLVAERIAAFLSQP